MPKAMIIMNPESGKQKAPDLVEPLQEILQTDYDSVHLIQSQSMEDLCAWAKQSATDQYDAVFLMGGDGTINAGMNAILPYPTRPTLGIVPLGTFNNAASMLGFPRNYNQAIQAYQSVKKQWIDIGQCNQTYFLSSVAIGPIVESIKQMDSHELAEVGSLDYFKQVLSSLEEGQAQSYRITKHGQTQEYQYSLIVLSLGNALLRMQHLFQDARLDDGLLNLVGLKESTLSEKIGLATQILNRGVLANDLIDYDQLEECQIHLEDSTSESHCNLDGDQGPLLPLQIKVIPRALEVFVPLQAESTP